MSECNILMDLLNTEDYKTRCQERLTMPPHSSGHLTAFHLLLSPASHQSDAFLPSGAWHSHASVLCLPCEQWFMADIRGETTSFHSPYHFSYLYRVLIKQHLQTYLCDVMLGSSAVNTPLSMSTEFRINKRQNHATQAPCRLFSLHDWKPRNPHREMVNS